MIYLDYQATTPLAPEARAAMMPLLEDGFGNPHSPHRLGRAAAAAVEAARDAVAGALGVGAEEGRLLFTSGATEAANLAIQGALMAGSSRRLRVVTIATEHACVLDTTSRMADWGYDPVVLPVGPDGIVDPDVARRVIDGRTALVAVMLVNNEIGVIQPIHQLADLAREAGALFFCDAAQGYGRVAVPVRHCDMIAVSAHKIHGPKGIGALWVRNGVKLRPLIHGGGQEAGLRSGTLSPALCAGFGMAARLADERRDTDRDHVGRLWGRIEAALDEDWIVNGAIDHRWRGNLNIRQNGLDAARLISELRDIAFSAGSACASGSGRPSHVLKAIGLDDAEARSSIRIGFGRYTSEDDIDRAAAMIRDAVARQGMWSA